MNAERRVILMAVASVVALVAFGASDFIIGSFWSSHAMLTSLIADLLIVVITVVVLNEAIERRSRRRWSVLAQGVLFELVQGARGTWTAFVDVLRLGEIESGTTEGLLAAVALVRDVDLTTAATKELLADPLRRGYLRGMTRTVADHYGSVIAQWASMMVSAAPYAELFDRHVELYGRLDWLASVLAHNEPQPDQSRLQRGLTRSSVATERASEFGDDWILDNVLVILRIAPLLDYESREQAFALVPPDWWTNRTTELLAR